MENDRNEKTVFDNGESERAEKTQVVSQEEEVAGRTQIGVPAPEPKAASWEPLASDVAHRVSPKSYYADDSVFGKLFNAFTLITLVAGLIIGLAGGYWLRGLFVTLEPAPPKVARLDAEISPSPDVEPAEAPSPADEVPTTEVKPTTPAPAERVEEPAEAAAAPEAEKSVAPAQKVAQKKIAAANRNIDRRTAITRVRVITAANQVNAEISMGGGPFKYTSRIAYKPLRLVLDIAGMSKNLGKSTVIAPPGAKPLTKVQVAKQGNAGMRVSLLLNGKTPPSYNISRTKQGLRITFQR